MRLLKNLLHLRQILSDTGNNTIVLNAPRRGNTFPSTDVLGKQAKKTYTPPSNYLYVYEDSMEQAVYPGPL